MGKYNSLRIYQENINFFWSVNTHNQGLFYVRHSGLGPGQRNKGGKFVFLFFQEHFQSVPDIIYKLCGISNTDMDRGIYTNRSSALLC